LGRSFGKPARDRLQTQDCRSRLTIGDWPLTGSNAMTLALMALILAMKLRYG
jgi:hypothetical protein